MAHGAFVWADLSTFRIDLAERFYEAVMGWTFADGIASSSAGPVASIFTMPETFQKIGMPSFWMSYIAVDDAGAVAARAAELGGKVELGPEPYADGRIALIRDPLGAGFTVYEGPALSGAAGAPGTRLTHGLFVSDSSAIISFYETLFGWSFGPVSGGVQEVKHGQKTLFHCHSIPDPNIRGEEEYWAVMFAPPDAEALARVTENGGTVLAQVDLPEGLTAICADPDGGTFFLVEGPGTSLAQPFGTHMASLLWKA